MFKRFILAIVITFMFAGMTASTASAAVPNACQPGTSEACPIPLRFVRGSYGAMTDGVLRYTPETRYYAVTARAGQRMTITFVGLGAMRAGLLYPNGSGQGPFGGEGGTITLPSNGTYIIYLSQNTMAGDPWRGGFTLSVLVR
jgi:hypothetical protein